LCTVPTNNNITPNYNDGCRIKYPGLGCIQCYKYYRLDQDQSGNGVCTPFWLIWNIFYLLYSFTNY
jgi:hypothetical protein